MSMIKLSDIKCLLFSRNMKGIMDYNIMILLILALILGLFVQLSYPYKCIHSTVSAKHRVIQSPSSTPGLMHPYKIPSVPFTPMNITTSYTNNLAIPTPELDVHIKQLVKISQAFWKQVLSVQSTKIMFPWNFNDCAEYNVTAEDKKMKESDLHLFITVENNAKESFIAWASACAIAPNGRPIFGRINYNTHYVTSANKSNYYFQKDLETTIHQMIHVLGFSPPLFDYWVTKPMIVKNGKFTTLVTAPLNEFMSSHFNCKMGAALENQGGDGSIGAHWERSVFQNEIMTASDITERLVFSNLTMALLKSTGWYQVDTRNAEAFVWGKGQGCRFISSLCKGNFPQFCYNPNELSCTYDGSSIAICIADPFADSCQYYSGYKNTICQDESLSSVPYQTGSRFQYNSKCFHSNVIATNSQRSVGMDFRCYKYKCVGGSILVTIGNSTEVLCTKNGEQINVNTKDYKGFLRCPPSLYEFCVSANYTENYCYKNGYSINGQCVCAEGFYGPNCNNTCEKGLYTHNAACVGQCPASTLLNEKGQACVDTCPSETYETNGKCFPCPVYCTKCSQGICSACLKGSTLVNGICTANTPTFVYETILLPIILLIVALQ